MDYFVCQASRSNGEAAAKSISGCSQPNKLYDDAL